MICDNILLNRENLRLPVISLCMSSDLCIYIIILDPDDDDDDDRAYVCNITLWLTPHFN